MLLNFVTDLSTQKDVKARSRAMVLACDSSSGRMELSIKTVILVHDRFTNVAIRSDSCDYITSIKRNNRL